MLKTAIFGGTFNPPHNGHVAMLNYIAGLDEIGKILIIPANLPPHKDNDIVPAVHRVNMCKAAFSDVKKAELCLLELEMQGKSYTLNTLEKLNEQGITNPLLVIGADSLVTFNKWYRYEQILNMAELLVYPRQGINQKDILTSKALLEERGAKIRLLDFTPPAISSTMVRKTVSNKGQINDFVPNAVAKYIKENGLYNGTNLFK